VSERLLSDVANPIGEHAYADALRLWAEFRLPEAEEACRRVLSAEPNHAGALALLADIVLWSDEPRLAVMLAERAVAAGASEEVLACALIAAGEPQEALSALGGSSGAPPERADALVELGDAEAAAAAFGETVAADPEERNRYARIATRLVMAGRLGDARRILARGMVAAPGDAEIQHLLASLDGMQVPRCPEAYIVEYFNRYAPTFDERLTGLAYRLPELIPAALGRRLRGKRTAILDAGCGTGMLAAALRPLAERLVGVDLSSGMLARARGTGLYDELAESELIGWLNATPKRFGAAVVADVLVYFGELDAVISGLARVLEPDSVLALSTESADHGGWELGIYGRYRHDQRYVTRTLTERGFTSIETVACSLRMQAGKPTPGTIVTARRG
jgi:predicted TPR repeat methyltransferase